MSMRDRKRVIVVGHINHDRIWRLTEPLRAGGRIAWSSRETRLGGGGYFTARRLLELGHDVALLSNLMTDGHGREALTALQVAGFDTTLITQREGETDFADILLDPTGSAPSSRASDACLAAFTLNSRSKQTRFTSTRRRCRRRYSPPCTSHPLCSRSFLFGKRSRGQRM